MRKRRNRETIPPEMLCQIAQERGPEGERAFGELLALVDRHLYAIQAQFYVPGMTAADLHQEALYCLRYRVIPTYDPSRATFVGFTRMAIRRHLSTVLKQADASRSRALNRGASFSAMSPDGDDGQRLDITNAMVDGRAESPLDRLAREESNARLLREILALLSPFERAVMEALRTHGSYASAARALEVSVRAIDNARIRVRKKAQALLTEERQAEALKEERQGRGDGNSEGRVHGGQGPGNRDCSGERCLHVRRHEGARRSSERPGSPGQRGPRRPQADCREPEQDGGLGRGALRHHEDRDSEE